MGHENFNLILSCYNLIMKPATPPKKYLKIIKDNLTDIEAALPSNPAAAKTLWQELNEINIDEHLLTPATLRALYVELLKLADAHDNITHAVQFDFNQPKAAQKYDQAYHTTERATAKRAETAARRVIAELRRDLS